MLTERFPEAELVPVDARRPLLARLPELPVPQARALGAALALHDTPAGDPPPYAVCMATLTLLTSELVTNAVLHARGPIEFEVTIDDDVIELRVTDQTTEQPKITFANGEHVGGAGLRIVDRLARYWGVEQRADGDRIVGCAELAPLSPAVAEIRSLVVSNSARQLGIGNRMVEALAARARNEEFARLCAFAHDPAFFVRRDLLPSLMFLSALLLFPVGIATGHASYDGLAVMVAVPWAGCVTEEISPISPPPSR